MAYTTDTALLASVRDALAKLASGAVQAYMIGDRRVTYQDLAELRDWEQDLVRRTAPAAARRGIALARFRSPS